MTGEISSNISPWCSEEEELKLGEIDPDPVQVDKRLYRYVWFTFAVDGESMGDRMVVELHGDLSPFTAEEFRKMCTGEPGFSYKGCRIFEAMEGKWALTGDTESNDGFGNKTPWGQFMGIEDTRELHVLKYTIGIKRYELHKLGSQFCISAMANAGELDDLFQVVGRACRNVGPFEKMMSLIASENGEPKRHAIIEDCGAYEPGWQPPPIIEGNVNPENPKRPGSRMSRDELARISNEVARVKSRRGLLGCLLGCVTLNCMDPRNFQSPQHQPSTSRAKPKLKSRRTPEPKNL